MVINVFPPLFRRWSAQALLELTRTRPMVDMCPETLIFRYGEFKLDVRLLTLCCRLRGYSIVVCWLE